MGQRKSNYLRLLAATLWITLVWVLADAWIRYWMFPHGIQPFRTHIYLKSIFLAWMGAIFFVSACTTAFKLSKAMGYAVASLGALTFAVDFVSNAYIYKYFHTYMSRYHIGFFVEDMGYILKSVGTYPGLGQYLVIIFFFLIMFLPTVFFSKRMMSLRFFDVWILIYGAAAVYGLIITNMKIDPRHFIALPNVNASIQTVAYLRNEHTEKERPKISLGPRTKMTVPPASPVISKMKTVVLFLNESWGKDYFSGDPTVKDNSMPLLSARMLARPNDFNFFREAFSNSSATDVSWPSILSGIGPQESSNALQVMPIITDYAIGAGFNTWIFSSWQLRWANIKLFMGAENFDVLVDRESVGGKVVNDLGMDDMITANEAAKYIADIKDPEQTIFIIFASNALHHPYQQYSDLLPNLATEVPGFNALSPHEKGLHILDHTIETVMQALEKAGRYEDAMMIFTSDHGDGLRFGGSIPRVANFQDYFMQVPFVVKLPASTPHDMRKTLQANLGKNVQNLDIAPTLAQLFGYCKGKKVEHFCNVLRGRSLFKPIQNNRYLLATSTNDVRHWVPEGFGIFQGGNRYIFSSVERRMTAFDVKTDPKQKVDIWDKIPEDRKKQIQKIINDEKHLERIYETYEK